LGYELGQILGIIHDVNLFVIELRLDSSDSLAQFPNAGTLGVDCWILGANGNLGSVASFSSNRNNLNNTFGDFWNF
jgi:hypothetical protein